MAFSIRKIISQITSFKKPDDEALCATETSTDPDSMKNSNNTMPASDPSEIIAFERIEPDSTSRKCVTSPTFPECVKNIAIKQGSLSDTDLVAIGMELNKKEKRKSKRLKLDITKAKQSSETDLVQTENSNNIENTPKHKLLESKSSDAFSERIKQFNFNKSFDLFEIMSDSSINDDNLEMGSLSNSDTDLSISSQDKTSIKMCKKVGQTRSDMMVEERYVSVSPESFGDIQVDKNEDERLSLLSQYQNKLQKMDYLLRNMLSDFRFHIEVSKVFKSRAIVTPDNAALTQNIELSNSDANLKISLLNSRASSPTGSWNLVLEKEDRLTKLQMKNQLLSMKKSIETFVEENLRNTMEMSIEKSERKFRMSKTQKRVQIKKRLKYFDFPDLSEGLINLFNLEVELEMSQSDQSLVKKDQNADLFNDIENEKCSCKCHNESISENDSGLTTKSEEQSFSVTSSIGNFSLDSTTLTAYSESLDLIISYNSFQDTSLYSTMLQKAAIERITFYVQVHSIQLKCDISEDCESKSNISFHCPGCQVTENDENGLLKHILSQAHNEKIHFLYKTAYIKKCVVTGKEIQPSTVLNPMKLYRDDNKIVCFGDAMYACSLCFENLIVGESVLMKHIAQAEHIDRRERLDDILE